ncbi:peptidase E [Jeotgalibacillus sp. R-1-5s-1]|uniref:Type 1 glutamine amidotransferase-like domain-containing protein n=1 Tax=Jeotgalibacillus sp. R-1-5s-1 TaxID=2555897 RepID=UPI001069F24E|nr:peptidase E [Jeotgalibacillus sp. R-1-5s-1]TFD92934.1 peptidase E [Jeotgalibacillus sp. R-1-5s-1]
MRQIIALSGGGFSTGRHEDDDYIVKQINKTGPLNVCFIPTASGDAPGYIENFHQAFKGHLTSHILMRDLSEANLNKQDLIYVGGGSTQFMLSKWRETGFDVQLKEAYDRGIVIAGISAGAMCWFEECFSEGADETWEQYAGLGFLKGTFCPHYQEGKRQLAFDQWSQQIKIEPAFKMTDHEGVHFVNEQVHHKLL